MWPLVKDQHLMYRTLAGQHQIPNNNSSFQLSRNHQIGLIKVEAPVVDHLRSFGADHVHTRGGEIFSHVGR